jgi:type IV secretory pathway VirB10-like protein
MGPQPVQHAWLRRVCLFPLAEIRLIGLLFVHTLLGIVPIMRVVACAAILIAALMLATSAVAHAYTNGGPSQATIEMIEKQARESAEQATKEKQEREAKEHPPASKQPPQAQSQEPAASSEASSAPVARCVVPSLKGDSLQAARNALGKAHCKLGKVSVTRAHRGALVVMRQGTANGRKLAGEAAIAVTLGPAKVKGRRT